MRLFGVREQGATRITSNFKRLMRNRDFHKKQAIKHVSSAHWNIYKIERNRVNIAMRSAQKVYFRDKVKECSQSRDVKKSWNLINTLLSRNKKTSNVNELHINNSVVVDNKQIADVLNEYFVQIGPKLAAEVCDPTNISDIQGCSNSYSGPRVVFSQISQINVATSLRRLKVAKATGMDNIPAKILKISVNIIAPSLTAILNLSLNHGRTGLTCLGGGGGTVLVCQTALLTQYTYI